MPALVDVWVKHRRAKLDFRRFLRVLVRKLKVEEEGTAGEARVFRPKDDRIPVENVAFTRGGGDACRWACNERFVIAQQTLADERVRLNSRICHSVNS